MAANIRKTAMGQSIDIDRLRLANESTITVGNTRTNARGDQLGPGGKVIKSRAQIQQEYYKLNTPVASDIPVETSLSDTPKKPTVPLLQPTAINAPVATSNQGSKLRGSLADAVAKETEIKQELLEPKPLTGSNKSTGVKRI